MCVGIYNFSHKSWLLFIKYSDFIDLFVYNINIVYIKLFGRMDRLGTQLRNCVNPCVLKTDLFVF